MGFCGRLVDDEGNDISAYDKPGEVCMRYSHSLFPHDFSGN